jgi:hypothetical protein
MWRRFLIAVLLWPAVVLAQGEPVLVAPRATAATAAEWRAYLGGEVREAVVVLAFTVKADGTTTDVTLTDGFYSEAIASKVLNRQRNARYEPATLGGRPIDYYNNTVTIRLGHNFGQAITPGFRSQYDAVQAIYQKGDYAGAVAQIETLIKTRVKGLFEYAFLNKALIPLYARLNKPDEALRASRLATLEDVPPDLQTPTGTLIRPQASKWPYLLPRDLLLSALRMRFELALQQGLLAEAQQVHEELNRIEPMPAGDPLTVALNAAFDGARNAPLLVSAGRISQGEWTFNLLRRTFTFKDVQEGQLTGIDLVCRVERRSLQFKPDAEWTIPAGWGDCALQLSGSEGTRFSLVQLQSGGSANELANAKPWSVPADALPGRNRGSSSRGGTLVGDREQAEEALRWLKGRP